MTGAWFGIIMICNAHPALIAQCYPLTRYEASSSGDCLSKARDATTNYREAWVGRKAPSVEWKAFKPRFRIICFRKP